MLGSHAPSSLHMRINWNSLLCSPAAIPPQAAILLNLINYRGGCGWISTPKGNLYSKLTLLWEGESRFSRWHSYFGVSTDRVNPFCLKPWRMLDIQGGIIRTIFFSEFSINLWLHLSWGTDTHFMFCSNTAVIIYFLLKNPFTVSRQLF